MDFPDNAVPPLFVMSSSRYSVGIVSRAHGINMGFASFNWPAAGQAQYLPFSLPWYYPVRRLFWVNGNAVGGTATIGIYTEDGANLYRSAATTTANTLTVQYVSVSPEILMAPGMFYIGLAYSGTTSVSTGSSGITPTAGRQLGMLQQSAIPAAGTAATFAQWNSTGLGMCGFTQTASGF